MTIAAVNPSRTGEPAAGVHAGLGRGEYGPEAVGGTTAKAQQRLQTHDVWAALERHQASSGRDREPGEELSRDVLRWRIEHELKW